MRGNYDSSNPSSFSFEECEAAIGSRATLVLTGKIIGAAESGVGSFVRFQPDARFGLNLTFGMDLDAFEVDEP